MAVCGSALAAASTFQFSLCIEKRNHFAADRVEARSRYAFSPFGSGPRVCIGACFATIEAAMVLAALVRAFHFRPVAGVQTGGMPLLVTARANKPTALSRQQPARLRKA